MKNLIGIPARRKPLTDAEYVERVRKEERRCRSLTKWYALLVAVIGIAWLYLVIYSIEKLAQGLLGNPANQLLVGYALGAIFGFISGAIAFKVAHLAVQAITVWKGDRKSQLLLRYHDHLCELAKQDETSRAIIEDGAGEGRGVVG